MIKVKKITRSTVKRHVLNMLKNSCIEEFDYFFETKSEHLVLNCLFSALCHPVELVRWRSVSSFGLIVPRLAERNMEDARIVMRRFLWMLNDESGGIGWGVPESLAEIMCHCKSLRSEYLHMLLSYMRRDGGEMFQDGNFLELPMLQRGLLWGVGRLAECHHGELTEKNIVEDLVAYLASPDLKVAGMAIWVLGLLKATSSKERIAPFVGREELVTIYKNNSIGQLTIGELAEEAMLSMNCNATS